MEPHLQLRVKPAMKLRLTPQLKVFLTILQKPILDLKTSVDQALAENPFLESEGTPERELSLEQLKESHADAQEDWLGEETDPSAVETLQEQHDYLMSLRQAPSSLYEELLKQLHLAASSAEDLRIGAVIVDSLNSHGYLTTPVGEIARALGVAEEAVARAVQVIQSLEPAGVGARNLQECLLIQLRARKREGSLAWRLVSDCFDDLGKRRFERIARRMGVSPEAIREAVREVVALDPKPGRAFGTSALAIVPDLAVERVDDRLEVECLNGYLPKLKVRSDYRLLLRSGKKDASLEEMKRLYLEAVGLVKSLENRKRTMEKVAEVLLEEQAEFFEKGVGYLKPLTARELARKLRLHESTISRAVSDKYIATPFGLFPLKDLLAKKVLTSTGEEFLKDRLKEAVQEAVAQENPAKPLTDEEISSRLQTQGITVARRTVAKYREILKLLPAHLRKKAGEPASSDHWPKA